VSGSKYPVGQRWTDNIEDGRRYLMHYGIMAGGDFRLTLEVVPGSGTGELEGLSGTMTIRVAPDCAHAYEFDFSLPDGK